MEFQVIRIRKKCSQMYGKFYLCIHMKTFVMSLLYLLRVYTFIFFFLHLHKNKDEILTRQT